MRLPDRAGSRAVLIGVGNYEHMPALTGVQAGAKALRSVLVDPVHGSLAPEHCVLVPERATVAEVGEAITIAAGEATDLLLIYFAGHGVRGRRRGDLHIALADTVESRAQFTGIPWDHVRDAVHDSRAKLKVQIVDCCFAGRARGQTMSAESDVLASVAIEGSATMTSVPPNYQAIILPGEKYPAYTKRLVDLLRAGLPEEGELLSLPRVHHHLYARLRSAGLRPPEAEWVALIDQLGLVRNRAWGQPASRPVAAEPLTRPSTTETQDKITRDVQRPDPVGARTMTTEMGRGTIPPAPAPSTPSTSPPQTVKQRLSGHVGRYFAGAVSALPLPGLWMDLFTSIPSHSGPIANGLGVGLFVSVALLLPAAELLSGYRGKSETPRLMSVGAGLLTGLATVLTFGYNFMDIAYGVGGGFLYFLVVRLAKRLL